jgi:hypothetical protein
MIGQRAPHGHVEEGRIGIAPAAAIIGKGVSSAVGEGAAGLLMARQYLARLGDIAPDTPASAQGR